MGTFSVMIADIDYFKNYNDAYGHAEGDRALKKIAEKIANRILITIADLAIEHRGSPYRVITISGGIVEYSSSFSSPEEIIKAADQKLYSAKNAGRNKIKA